MVTAKLKNYRQSPRKVRLVADFIRGKKVTEAIDKLQFVSKKAADPILKLIASAVANAENNNGLKAADLYVKEIRVDKGVTLYRHMPRAHGRAFPIRKRCSNLIVSLDSKEGIKKEKKEAAKKAPVKKTPAKKVAKKKVAKKAPAKKVASKKAKDNK